jgi:hypothetical protein
VKKTANACRDVVEVKRCTVRVSKTVTDTLLNGECVGHSPAIKRMCITYLIKRVDAFLTGRGGGHGAVDLLNVMVGPLPWQGILHRRDVTKEVAQVVDGVIIHPCAGHL